MAPRNVQRYNMREYVRAIRVVGDKWLAIPMQLERKS
jgi:hypothetical protein